MALGIFRAVHRGKVKTVICLLSLTLVTLLIQMHKVFTIKIVSNTKNHKNDYRSLEAHLRFQDTELNNASSSRTLTVPEVVKVPVHDSDWIQEDKLKVGVQCPIKYNYTACSFELNSQPSEKINREVTGRVIRYIYKFRQGMVKINGTKVYTWKTTANLIIVQLSQLCQFMDARQYPNPDEPSSKKDDQEFAGFVDGLPKGTVLLGILYGDTTSYSKVLSDLGLTRKLVSQMVYRRGILAFQARKGYLGHSKYTVNPKGGGNNTVLRNAFHIGHPFNYDATGLPYGTVLQRHREMNSGGHWRPLSCDPRWRIAIIIPFRQRELHLWTFLDNMFRFLQLQNIEFTIFVVEQAGDVLFNRAALMNIGFIEAKKRGHFDCYAFHDVDQIPEDLSNLYQCSDMPRHLVVTRSVTEYRLRVEYYFGGAIMMSADHIEQINGFPNRIFAWGGEDDEIWARVIHVGMSVLRYPMEIGRYKSLSHGQDKSNPHIGSRRSLDILQSIARYINRDGLNTMQYEIVSLEKRPLYTHLIVYIPGPSKLAEVQAIVNMTTTKAPALPNGIAAEDVQVGDVEIDTYYNDKSDKNVPQAGNDEQRKSRKLSPGALLNRKPSGNASPLSYRPQSHRVLDERPKLPGQQDAAPPVNADGQNPGLTALKQLMQHDPNLLANLLQQRGDLPQNLDLQNGLNSESKTILAQYLQQDMIAKQQLLNQVPQQQGKQPNDAAPAYQGAPQQPQGLYLNNQELPDQEASQDDDLEDMNEANAGNLNIQNGQYMENDQINSSQR